MSPIPRLGTNVALCFGHYSIPCRLLSTRMKELLISANAICFSVTRVHDEHIHIPTSVTGIHIASEAGTYVHSSRPWHAYVVPRHRHASTSEIQPRDYRSRKTQIGACRRGIRSCMQSHRQDRLNSVPRTLTYLHPIFRLPEQSFKNGNVRRKITRVQVLDREPVFWPGNASSVLHLRHGLY